MHEQVVSLREILEWTVPPLLGAIGWWVRKISNTLADFTTTIAVEKKEREKLEEHVEREVARLDRELEKMEARLSN